ncbi:hypothetical protein DFH06DRAFT_1327652 [Mycena polygramma]|nr:hypothetical protein DFH06DRAFT_1327652 [Mycena polygramma]
MPSQEMWPSRFPAHIRVFDRPSLFADSQSVCVEISGAGLSRVSVSVHDIEGTVAYQMHNVDTLKAVTNRPGLSWSIENQDQPPIRVELCFATLRRLETFLFALSFVRYTNGSSSMAISSVGLSRTSRAIAAADDAYLGILSESFVSIRGIPRVKCPISRLPFELVSYILLLCAPHRPADRLVAPLRWLQVCSRWRTIASDTAGLWREPVFTLSRSFFAARGNHEAQLTTWMRRAKSSIKLSLIVGDAQYLPHEIFDIAQHNPSLYSQVYSLHICSPLSQLCNLLRGATGSDTTTLHSVSLLISNCNSTQSLPHVQLFRSAPRLRKLTIEAEGFLIDRQLSDKLLAFPWSQLTELTLKLELEISTWILIFSQCSALHSASFIVRNEGPEPYYPTVPVTYHDLESLRVSFRGFFEPTFFTHLLFPAIQTLHVSGLVDPPRPTPVLPHLTTLRNLSLDVPGLAPRLLENIVDTHPSLEHLGFIMDDEVSYYSVVIRRLQNSGLRTLTVSTPYEDSFPELALFVTYIKAWAIQQALAGRHFRLFGKTKVLTALKNALAPVVEVQAMTEFDPVVDAFDDPFTIFPYSRMTSLSVRRRATARNTYLDLDT